MRRLAALDGARAQVPAGMNTQEPPPARDPNLGRSEGQMRRVAPRSRRLNLDAGNDEVESRTIVLPSEEPRKGNKVLYAALGLVALAVLATVLFPDLFAKAFTVKQFDKPAPTSPTETEIDLELEEVADEPGPRANPTPSVAAPRPEPNAGQ